MTAEEVVQVREQELMLVVERLSTQDQRRIVNLVELLVRAPSELRKASQSKLRHLLARDSVTEDECLEGIDRVLAGIERELGGEAAPRSQADLPQPALQRVATGA